MHLKAFFKIKARRNFSFELARYVSIRTRVIFAQRDLCMGEFPPLHLGWDSPSPPLSRVVEDKEDENGENGMGGAGRQRKTRKDKCDGRNGEIRCRRKRSRFTNLALSQERITRKETPRANRGGEGCPPRGSLARKETLRGSRGGKWCRTRGSPAPPKKRNREGNTRSGEPVPKIF